MPAEPVVRDFRPADREPVGRLLTAAFRRPAVAELAAALRASDAHRGALVADLPDAEHPDPNGQIPNEQLPAGLVQLSRGWLDAPDRLVEVLVLSPLGVRPELQGRGVGGCLVRAAIAAAAEQQAPLLFLEGSPRYYPRFGFRPAGDLGFGRPSHRIPEPAFQVVTLPGWQRQLTGRLVYPDAFWRFDSVGLRDQG